MTTVYSTAVVSGIMPDHTKAGLVLRRNATYVTTSDGELVSGDTIQMVPIPEGAQILDVQIYCSGNAALATGLTVGDGNSARRFFDGPTFTGDHLYGLKSAGAVGDVAGVKVGSFLYQYASADTIDIFLKKTAASTYLPTSITFKMSVEYCMAGSIEDEDFSA
uniref:Uncharacterized protein n=1 Tax=viral metagenome TaxID=1070528 RepID=A0A6M3L6H8_9ZZZZ